MNGRLDRIKLAVYSFLLKFLLLHPSLVCASWLRTSKVHVHLSFLLPTTSFKFTLANMVCQLIVDVSMEILQ